MQQVNLEAIRELRHRLHRCAELSLQEHRTRETLIEFLNANTTLEVTNVGRWFYALKRGRNASAPITAIRADFDALPIPETIDVPYASLTPGVSHKCGHDGHSSILSGVAMELSSVETEGDVYLIFQHAEEIGAGGEECSRFIEDKGISRVYALHNWSGFPEHSVIVRDGVSQCASMGLTVRFLGIRSHASEPEHGISPAPAVARLALDMQKYSRPAGDPRGLMLCTIVHMLVGSRDFGCAPGYGEISATLRTELERDLNGLSTSIRKAAEGYAGEYGLRVEFEESDRFPDTKNDSNCIKNVVACAHELGLDVITLKDPIRGSEDFGWFLKKCPGAIFYLGNGETYPAIHTLEYDFNDQILENGVDMFLALIRKQ